MHDRHSISLLTEIPTELHRSLRDYLDAHPDWDQDRVLTVALSLFFTHDRERLQASLNGKSR